MLLIISIFILFFISLSHSIYTNKQAYQCFQQNAIHNCNQQIQKCLKEQQCQNEIKKYQKCQFSQEQQLIFNGYCFRVWYQEAVQTRQLADCLIKECDLLYNSEIGLEELFKCTKQNIFENYQKCDEQCKSQLHKIQSKFNNQKLSQLFSITLDNQIANRVVNLIRENCVEKYKQGKNKQQIVQQQQQEL